MNSVVHQICDQCELNTTGLQTGRMWANGMINRHYADPTSNEPTPSHMDYCGSDPEGPTPLEEHGSVVVNDIFTPLDENVFEKFRHLVDPLDESDSFGIDIYIRAIESLSEIQERHS